MTITKLILYVGLVAVLLTLLTRFVFKKDKSLLTSYLQNFTGALFIFSGWVKAIDPLGTAYKMEDYFNEFYYTFSDTWMSFIAPLFTFMHDQSVIVSVIFIVFEIVVGIMLILGIKPKLTAWMFFLLIAFFTVLTGYTYLTGYVPQGVNFFSFGEWGPYVKSNMKVTDCGCFGDFIKLEPFTSFLKDVFLLVPAIYFIFQHKKMHQLFSANTRGIIFALSAIGLTMYCLSNFSWDLPHTDFRPFKNGANIAEQRQVEMNAAAATEITAYKLKNMNTGKMEELPSDQYMTLLKEGKYTKNQGWEVYEQVISEPTVKSTKISEFWISDFDGNDINDSYLNNEDYKLMVVSYKMLSDDQESKINVRIDTLYRLDTIINDQKEIQVNKIVDDIVRKEEKYIDYIWDPTYMDDFKTIVKPMSEAAKADGVEMSVVLGAATTDMAVDFATELEAPVNYETADDILLKTIVRSNPGFVLWKDGKIVHKWHKNHVPTYDEIKSNYMK